MMLTRYPNNTLTISNCSPFDSGVPVCMIIIYPVTKLFLMVPQTREIVLKAFDANPGRSEHYYWHNAWHQNKMQAATWECPAHSKAVDAFYNVHTVSSADTRLQTLTWIHPHRPTLSQSMNPWIHDNRIPLWLLHSIWQVHNSKANSNFQFLLVVEQLPARWGIVHYVYDKAKSIDITWVAPRTS